MKYFACTLIPLLIVFIISLSIRRSSVWISDGSGWAVGVWFSIVLLVVLGAFIMTSDE